MPKRPRQSDSEILENALKKQISSKDKGMKIRDIKSVSSERTINMLFEAASQKSSVSEVPLLTECSCTNINKTSNQCYFCDKMICSNCFRPCDKCKEIFCEKCSFLTYDDECDCVCYSCMDK